MEGKPKRFYGAWTIKTKWVRQPQADRPLRDRAAQRVGVLNAGHPTELHCVTARERLVTFVSIYTRAL